VGKGVCPTHKTKQICLLHSNVIRPLREKTAQVHTFVHALSDDGDYWEEWRLLPGVLGGRVSSLSHAHTHLHSMLSAANTSSSHPPPSLQMLTPLFSLRGEALRL